MDKRELILNSKGKNIDLYLQEMEKTFFTGSVLIKHKGEVILSKGYGKASSSLPNTPETIFHVASITKQFTAAAILLLMENRKIDLDCCINEYLPHRYCTKEWDDVSVDHLLSHTSGIPNYAEWDDYWDICKELTIDKIIHEVQEQGLLFHPGENFSYSNTGYTLLGKIIEEQGKMPYEDFIKKKLLIPAGMTSSGIHTKNCSLLPSPSATGFCLENQHLIKDQRDEFAILYSDGGLYTTLGDLAKWSKVLDGKSKVLSRKIVDLMIEREYGLWVGGRDFETIYYNGSMAGFRASFYKFPEQDLLIVILGNNSDFILEYLVHAISSYLLFENKTLHPPISFPSNFDYSPYLKKFTSKTNDNEDVVFHLQNGQLFFCETTNPCFLLSNQALFIPTLGLELKLEKNGNIFVYDEEGKRCDKWIPSSFIRNFFTSIRQFFFPSNHS